MKLLQARDLDPRRFRRVARHGALGTLVVLLAVLGGPGFAAVGAGALLRGAPLWAWLLAGAVALLLGLFLLLVAATLLDVFLASFRRTNWWAAIEPEGLYLNLRSYRNHHYPDDHPTVAFLGWPELAAAGKVLETTLTTDSDGAQVRHTTPRLELVLRSGDTAPVEDALARERALEPPTRRFLGVSSSTRHAHWPVQVHEPGRLCIDWPGRRFVAALPDEVERLATRRTDFGLDRGRSGDAQRAARELAARGMELEATKRLCEGTGMGLAEARSLVRELAREPLAAERSARG